MSPHPLHGSVHHNGYIVDNLDQTLERLVKMGAGPFFLVRSVPLDSVSSGGAPAVFDHASAFGWFGAVPIEVMQLNRCEPEAVAKGFAGTAPFLHHVAWALPAEDVQPARDQLAADGLPAYVNATLGDINFTYHDGSSIFGHHLEIHTDSPGFRDHFTNIRTASIDWDGSDPVRVVG